MAEPRWCKYVGPRQAGGPQVLCGLSAQPDSDFCWECAGLLSSMPASMRARALELAAGYMNPLIDLARADAMEKVIRDEVERRHALLCAPIYIEATPEVAAALARGRLHVDTIWYEQTTEGTRLRGEVEVRLSTGGDHYHRTVAIGPESYQSARRIAERLGLELQVALDLREQVAAWEGGAA